MDQYHVSVVPCEDYDDARVEEALREVLEPIGGLDFVQPGMVVAVKVNLVTAMKPETAATVHPSVVCALVRLLPGILPEGRDAPEPARDHENPGKMISPALSFP